MHSDAVSNCIENECEACELLCAYRQPCRHDGKGHGRAPGLVARSDEAGHEKNANQPLAFPPPYSMPGAYRLAFCAGIDTIDGLLGSGT